MNIYTVTYLNRNYGSILQAYALQSRLKEYGAMPVILQTIVKKPFPRLRFLWRLIRPEKNYSLCQRIDRWRDSRKYAAKNEKLGIFITKRIKTYKVENSQDFLKSISSDDIFLAGSDQIWSTLNGSLSPWYSLQWVTSGNRRYSYAASLGQCTLSEDKVQEYVTGLRSFQVISLRESQALQVLHPYFSGRIRHDLDPTLLYEGCHWRKLASQRFVEEPYVFVYMLRPDMEVINLARRIAKSRGLKVVYTGLYAYRFNDVTTILDAGAEDFLSYIDNAEVVITNSFHGTAFSVLFGKPFLSVKIASTSSRVENLLEMTGLMSQYVTDTSKEYPLDIDFSHAWERLDKERDNSLAYLESICKL